MTEIVPLPSELAEHRLSQSTLATAVAALLEDGSVILRGVVKINHIDHLRNYMESDLKRIQALPVLPENFTKGHLQQDPPPRSELLFRDIITNDLAAQITTYILGSKAKLVAYTGNTNLPGTKAQPVHPDFQQLWPNLSMAHPGYGFIINLPLVDVTAHNGAIELWPGTHRDTGAGMSDSNIRLAEEDLARWRQKRPPIQPSTKMGDLLIRDCRLWHRGMPNHSDQPRPMVATIVWAPWYATQEHLDMPSETKSFFDTAPLQVRVTYREDPIDHISRLRAFDVRDDQTDTRQVEVVRETGRP